MKPLREGGRGLLRSPRLVVLLRQSARQHVVLKPFRMSNRFRKILQI
jgi:hypothetical protein